MNKGDRVKTKTSDEFDNLEGTIVETAFGAMDVCRVRLKDRRIKLFKESELMKA